MKLCEINPFVRYAVIANAFPFSSCERRAYDNRLFLVLDGVGELSLNGTKLPVKKDTLIYISTKDSYNFLGKIKLALINFDFTMQQSHRKEPRYPAPCELYDESEAFELSVAEGYEASIVTTASEELRELILRLAKTHVVAGECADALCSAYMKEILARMSVAKAEAKDEVTLLSERLEHYIKSNVASIKSNADLGREFGYHPVYLAQIFKLERGKTLHEAILRERFALAKRWLRSTNASVEHIADEVGFSSKSYFCTAFKKEFGITPLAYRKSREPMIL